MRINAEPQPGTADAEALEKFFNYGTPFRTQNASVSLVVDAPGGLSGALPLGRLWVGPTAEDEAIPDRRLRLQVLDPNREVIAETAIRVRPPTTGVRRRGYRTTGRDEGGSFTIEQIQDIASATSQSTLALQDVSGLIPADILPGLRALAAFHSPNLWRIGELRGPLADDCDPISAGPLDGAEELLLLVEAVDEIQRHTATQLRVPNTSELSDPDAKRMILAAALMRGLRVVENVSRYESEFDQDSAQMRAGGPQNVTWMTPLSVTIGSEEIHLGRQRRWAQGVQISMSDPDRGKVKFSMTPHEGETFVMQRARV
jgi:hypothetical protein